MSRRHLPQGDSEARGWTLARARVQQDSTADSTQRDELLEALDWFEGMVDCDCWTNRHPLAKQFFLAYDPGPYEGVRLRRLARPLETEPALVDVVKGLGNASWGDYFTAKTELEVAGHIRTMGHDLQLVERARGVAQTPDFRVRLHDRPVDFECTAVVESEPERKANVVFDRLFGYPLAHPSFNGAVVVRFRPGTTADAAFDRLPEVERAIETAWLEKRLASVPTIATVEPDAESSRPLSPYGSVTPEGMLVTDRPWIQLGRSLRKKLKRDQLANAECGIVLVRASVFSFVWGDDLATCLEAIHDLVCECLAETGSDVSAVLVYEKWRGEPEERFVLDRGSFVAVADGDENSWNRFIVLTRNPVTTHPLLDQEVTRVLAAARGW